MTRWLNLRQLDFLHCSVHKGPGFDRNSGLLGASLNRAMLHFTIHLESAVFVFHISATTQESPGHCEPRVLSPSNGFWLAPIS